MEDKKKQSANWYIEKRGKNIIQFAMRVGLQRINGACLRFGYFVFIYLKVKQVFVAR